MHMFVHKYLLMKMRMYMCIKKYVSTKERKNQFLTQGTHLYNNKQTPNQLQANEKQNFFLNTYSSAKHSNAIEC